MHKTHFLYIFLILGLIPIAVLYYVFAAYFGFSISKEPADWTLFSNYSQGVIGVYLAFVTFSGLIYTVFLQNKNISLLKDQLLQQEKQSLNVAIETHFFHLIGSYQNGLANFTYDGFAGQLAVSRIMDHVDNCLNFSSFQGYDSQQVSGLADLAKLIQDRKDSVEIQRFNLQINTFIALVKLIAVNINFVNLLKRAYEVSQEFEKPEKCYDMLDTLRSTISVGEKTLLTHIMQIGKRWGKVYGKLEIAARNLHIDGTEYDKEVIRLSLLYAQFAFYEKTGTAPAI